jgi:hypothetical protein
MNTNFSLILDGVTQAKLAKLISDRCNEKIEQNDISKMSGEGRKLVDKRKATIKALEVNIFNLTNY